MRCQPISFILAAVTDERVLTIKSSSRDSSMMFIAVKVSDVRPTVSINVLCGKIEAETSGTAVSYLTLLKYLLDRYISYPRSTHVAPSGRITLRVTFWYDTPSPIFGPSRNGTLRT